jgi:hypothetical protein
LDLDATVTSTETRDQFPVGVGKQQQAEAKENDHDRNRDNAERNEIEQAADMRLRCQEIRGRTRDFGGLGTGSPWRGSPREL